MAYYWQSITKDATARNQAASRSTGIIPMEACGVGYWIISSVQFPLAIIFTSCILYNREIQHSMPLKKQEGRSETKHGPSGNLIFPLMALLAGVLGGVFGIGGGMLISPLLIQVGITPERRTSSIVFCTNGVLLRVLVTKGSASFNKEAPRTMGKDDISDLTHIIVPSDASSGRISPMDLRRSSGGSNPTDNN